jgi:hypothetical protein
MSAYSASDLVAIFRRRLECLENNQVVIRALSAYAQLVSPYYSLFIDALNRAFDDSGEDIPRQLCLIYLIDQIMYDLRTKPDVIALFKPSLEHFVIKAAETRDLGHVRKAQEVLTFLNQNHALESHYVARLIERMAERTRTGPDEDFAISERFSQLNDQLVRTKQARRSAQAGDADDATISKLVQDEERIRDQITEFHMQQLTEQGKKIKELKGMVGGTGEEERQHTASILARLGGSSSDSEEDTGLL